jgi:hypothetical protein
MDKDIEIDLLPDPVKKKSKKRKRQEFYIDPSGRILAGNGVRCHANIRIKPDRKKVTFDL